MIVNPTAKEAITRWFVIRISKIDRIVKQMKLRPTAKIG